MESQESPSTGLATEPAAIPCAMSCNNPSLENIIFCEGCNAGFHEDCYGKFRPHATQPENHRTISLAERKRREEIKRDALPYRNQIVSKDQGIETVEHHFQSLAKEDRSRFIYMDLETHQLNFGQTIREYLRDDMNTAYPSFVSFRGETGGGKSTIICHLKVNEQAPWRKGEFQLPYGRKPVISRSGTTSTTADICIYPSRLGNNVERPVFFLDCEGAEGSSVPLGVQALIKNVEEEGLKKEKEAKNVEKEDPGSVIPLGVQGFLKKMKEDLKIVEQFRETRTANRDQVYPYLLYLFSDVMCYTSGASPKIATGVAEKIIAAARQGAKGSVNRCGFKPSLIVIFNKLGSADLRSQETVQSFTESFQDSIGEGLWTELQDYVGSVNVVHLPALDHQDYDLLIVQNMKALKGLISKEVDLARSERERLGMNFPVPFVRLLLQEALRIYSMRGPDGQVRRFDLSRAILQLTPVRGDRKDLFAHIWKACLGFSAGIRNEIPSHLREAWNTSLHYSKAATTKTLENLNPATKDFAINYRIFLLRIIDALHVWEARHKRRTTAAVLTEAEYTEIDDAISKIAGFQPCCYSFGNKDFCENNEKSHIGGHTMQGKSVPGAFEGLTLPTRKSWSPQEIDGRLRDLVRERMWCREACLNCASAVPVSVLKCGDHLCRWCIVENATPLQGIAQDSLYETVKCPLCPGTRIRRFQPRLLDSQAGSRILAIDGGGVRGAASLKIISELETLCLGVPITRLVDCIVGTSIGGIIALSYFAGVNRTTGSMAQQFEKTMLQVFPHTSIPGLKKLQIKLQKVNLLWGTVYDSPKKSLAEFFEENYKDVPLSMYHDMNEANDPNDTNARIHVATVSVKYSEQSVAIMSNYCVDDQFLDHPMITERFERKDYPALLSAMCTSAAYPVLPRVMGISPEDKHIAYLDGGFRFNCPASVAYDEARKLWPDIPVDLVLSIGNGQGHVDHGAQDIRQPWWVTLTRNPIQTHLARAAGLGVGVLDTLTNTEKMWDGMTRRLCGDEHPANKERTGNRQRDELERERSRRVRRLNPIVSKVPSLDDSSAIAKLVEETETWMNNGNDKGGAKLMQETSYLLLANLFFVHITAVSSTELTGEIRCRIGPGQEGFMNVMTNLRDCYKKQKEQREIFNVTTYTPVGKTVPPRSMPPPPVPQDRPICWKFSMSGIPDLNDHTIVLDCRMQDFRYPDQWLQAQDTFSIGGCPKAISVAIANRLNILPSAPAHESK